MALKPPVDVCRLQGNKRSAEHRVGSSFEKTTGIALKQ